MLWCADMLRACSLACLHQCKTEKALADFMRVWTSHSFVCIGVAIALCAGHLELYSSSLIVCALGICWPASVGDA
jgi:hypothetical protein